MMARKTLADRLQAGFEMVPLTDDAAEARRAEFEAKPWVQRMRKLKAIVTLSFVGLMLLLIGAAQIVWANWWATKTSVVCTIDDMDHYEVHGKGDHHTVYDVYTTTCGDLQIMPGAGRNGQQAIAFAETLRIGDTYEMDVRGWDGWLGNTRAIAGAKLIGGPQ